MPVRVLVHVRVLVQEQVEALTLVRENQVRRTDCGRQQLVSAHARGGLAQGLVPVLVLGPNEIKRLDHKLRQEQGHHQTCFQSVPLQGLVHFRRRAPRKMLWVLVWQCSMRTNRHWMEVGLQTIHRRARCWQA
jgi:hypothetical protein